MKSLLALSAVLSLASATPYDYNATGSFPQNLCTFNLADASGQAWRFDLSAIAGITQNFKSGPYVFAFAVCGVSGPECVPGFGQYWNLAAGYQLESGTPSGTCWSERSGYVPCTNVCEGLSIGPPQHQLLDPNNAATGGISTSFTGLWTQQSDFQKCGNVNPLTGKEMGRSLQINHYCNPAMPLGTVNITSQTELPECNYVISLTSASACASKTTSSIPLPPPGPPIPAYGPASTPYAPYLCNPNITDATGKNWAFSFNQLFNPTGDYSVTGSDGTVYNFNICGYTSTTCNPSYSVAANWGGVVATWAKPVTPPAGTVCYLSNGTASTCTPDCRTLADNAPFFSLTTPTNGASGGVTLALQGELVSGDEPAAYQCTFDPQGNPIPQSVTIQLSCDPSTPATKLVTTGVVTGPGACTYTIQAKTAAACGQ